MRIIRGIDPLTAHRHGRCRACIFGEFVSINLYFIGIDIYLGSGTDLHDETS